MNSYKFAFNIISFILIIGSFVAAIECVITSEHIISNLDVLMVLYTLGLAIYFQVCSIDDK
jgi:hypothetical protein